MKREQRKREEDESREDKEKKTVGLICTKQGEGEASCDKRDERSDAKSLRDLTLTQQALAKGLLVFREHLTFDCYVNISEN